MTTRLELGDKTERGIVNSIFRKNHYWVYNTPHKTNGQPVDIIAIRENNDETYNVFLTDAKHVEESKISFPFDRIESNQWTTMMYANEWAGLDSNKNLGFSILFDKTGIVYWLSYKNALNRKNKGEKSVRYDELEKLEDIV